MYKRQAYSIDGGAVQVTDLACGEKLPKEILDALEDETVEKWSYNSQFERICLSRLLGYPAGNYLAPASWRCSMAVSYTHLPSDAERIVAMVDSFTKTVARNFSRNLKRANANRKKHFSDEPI